MDRRWLALAGLGLATPASAQQTAERFARVVAADARGREEAFQRSGLAPAARVAAEGRSVRRFSFTIFPPNRIPVAELERRGARTVLRTYRAGKLVGERPVERRNWNALAALDRTLYAPPDFAKERERLSRPRTWSSCHGDRVAFQRIEHGRVSGAGGDRCADAPERIDEVRIAAAEVFARMLIEAEPSCRERPAADPLKAIEACFGYSSAE